MVGVEMLTESDEPIAARSRQAPEMIRIACVCVFFSSSSLSKESCLFVAVIFQ